MWGMAKQDVMGVGPHRHSRWPECNTWCVQCNTFIIIQAHKCHSSPSGSKGLQVWPGTHVGVVDVCAAAAAGEVAGELVERAVAPLARLAKVGAALLPPSLFRHLWKYIFIVIGLFKCCFRCQTSRDGVGIMCI